MCQAMYSLSLQRLPLLVKDKEFFRSWMWYLDRKKVRNEGKGRNWSL